MPSDMQRLRAVLATKRLSAGDTKAFTYMLQDLEDGRIIRLSQKQREWLDARWHDLGLEGKELPPAPTKRVTKAREAPRSEPYAWEVNRPLKPPTRKT